MSNETTTPTEPSARDLLCIVCLSRPLAGRRMAPVTLLCEPCWANLRAVAGTPGIGGDIGWAAARAREYEAKRAPVPPAQPTRHTWRLEEDGGRIALFGGDPWPCLTRDGGTVTVSADRGVEFELPTEKLTLWLNDGMSPPAQPGAGLLTGEMVKQHYRAAFEDDRLPPLTRSLNGPITWSPEGYRVRWDAMAERLNTALLGASLPAPVVGVREQETRADAGTERVLCEVDASGESHRHHLRILSVPFSGANEVMLEASEPDACSCVKRWALSEIVHFLLNASDDDVFAITCRSSDAAGHPHKVAVPLLADATPAPSQPETKGPEPARAGQRWTSAEFSPKSADGYTLKAPNEDGFWSVEETDLLRINPLSEAGRWTLVSDAPAEPAPDSASLAGSDRSDKPKCPQCKDSGRTVRLVDGVRTLTCYECEYSFGPAAIPPGGVECPASPWADAKHGWVPWGTIQQCAWCCTSNPPVAPAPPIASPTEPVTKEGPVTHKFTMDGVPPCEKRKKGDRGSTDPTEWTCPECIRIGHVRRCGKALQGGGVCGRLWGHDVRCAPEPDEHEGAEPVVPAPAEPAPDEECSLCVEGMPCTECFEATIGPRDDAERAAASVPAPIAAPAEPAKEAVSLEEIDAKYPEREGACHPPGYRRWDGPNGRWLMRRPLGGADEWERRLDSKKRELISIITMAELDAVMQWLNGEPAATPAPTESPATVTEDARFRRIALETMREVFAHADFNRSDGDSVFGAVRRAIDFMRTPRDGRTK